MEKEGSIVFHKFKSWLYGKFLPTWCVEDLTEENARLRSKIQEQSDKIARLNAYIDGMENAMRRQSRVIINCKEVFRQ